MKAGVREGKGLEFPFFRVYRSPAAVLGNPMAHPRKSEETKIVEEYDANEATGVEAELGAEEGSSTSKPYDPRKIRVDPKTFSLRQIIDMIEHGDLDLAPDFQRKKVWKVREKCRLIGFIEMAHVLRRACPLQVGPRLWIVVCGERVIHAREQIRAERRERSPPEQKRAITLSLTMRQSSHLEQRGRRSGVFFEVCRGESGVCLYERGDPPCHSHIDRIAREPRHRRRGLPEHDLERRRSEDIGLRERSACATFRQKRLTKPSIA